MFGNVYRQLKNSVRTVNNEYEIGGVLLGYTVLGYQIIVAATVQCDMAEKSRVSFVLDGDWHTRRVSELMQQFPIRPAISGIWHSHICDDAVFSAQDRRANTEFAATFGGVISMIATMPPPAREFRLTAYAVSPGGKERRCKLRLLPGIKLFPGRLFRNSE